MSLTPALEDARFCPRCAATATVAFLRRGFDPGAGRRTFPGGFVDLGALVGVYSRREDRVVLIVYRGRALGEARTTKEAVEVRAFARDALPWDELAFWLTQAACATRPRAERHAPSARVDRVVGTDRHGLALAELARRDARRCRGR